MLLEDIVGYSVKFLSKHLKIMYISFIKVNINNY
jgi:hypothetical protein